MQTNPRPLHPVIRWTVVAVTGVALFAPQLGIQSVATSLVAALAALLFPGRALVLALRVRGGWAESTGLSLLVLACGSWAGWLAGIPLQVAGVALIALATVTWAMLEHAAPQPRLGDALALCGVTLLAGLPPLLNGSLWTADPARLVLPHVGAIRGGHWENAFLSGTPGTAPWAWPALVAPFWAGTHLPAPTFAALAQIFAVVALGLAMVRVVTRDTTSRWAGPTALALCLGGLSAFGISAWFDPPSLDAFLNAHPWFDFAIRASAADPAWLAPLPGVWFPGPTPWALALVTTAWTLDASPGRLHGLLAGFAFAGAGLLHPLLGLIGLAVWLATRLPRHRASVLALVVVGLGVAATARFGVWTPGWDVHDPVLGLRAGEQSSRVILHAAPLLGLAVLGWMLTGRSRAEGAGLFLALGCVTLLATRGSALIGLLGALPLFVLLATRALVGACRRPWFSPIALALLAGFLLTPVSFAVRATQDASGALRWGPIERAMLRRADRVLPHDAVLLMPPTVRPVAEETVLLPRTTYYGAPSAITRFGTDDTALRAEERAAVWKRLVSQGYPQVPLDSMLVTLGDRPAYMVLTSEDHTHHPYLLEILASVVPRFEPVENGQRLKILRLNPAPPVAAPVPTATPADSLP